VCVGVGVSGCVCVGVRVGGIFRPNSVARSNRD